MDHSITLHALQARIGEVCIVDARRRTARDTSPEHLPGATWHDPEKLAEWAPALPRDCQIVVYCVHGHEVSQATAAGLREFGLDALYLEGGIEGWKAAGFATLDD
ncbi:MAG: hypothetical protein KDH17_16790 [Rhodocyclaceae bacterium]|nr:hypothetical protein [Rhodocyclaceae bacterium]